MDPNIAKLVADVKTGLSLGESSSKKKNPVALPQPWLAPRRAAVRPLDYLLSNGISSVTGDVYCKRCKYKGTFVYDLRQKFQEVSALILAYMEDMEAGSRAWMRPPPPPCPGCGGAGSLLPVLPKRKREIDWLFLFLGRMVGCCTEGQLTYFCKHNGTKPKAKEDRALLHVYVGVCLQLDPNSLF